MGKNNSWFLKGIVIGGVIGGLASLFHKETRENVGRYSKGAYIGGKHVVQTVKDNPDRLKEQLQSTSENMKTILDELKSEASDVADTYRGIASESDQDKD